MKLTRDRIGDLSVLSEASCDLIEASSDLIEPSKDLIVPSSDLLLNPLMSLNDLEGSLNITF